MQQDNHDDINNQSLFNSIALKTHLMKKIDEESQDDFLTFVRLMAPKLISKTIRHKYESKDLLKFKKIRKTINKYQKFIKKNFDYVGENFAYEARSIHYNEKKTDKGIYGTASKKDLKELKEEGIDAQVIPWIESENN